MLQDLVNFLSELNENNNRAWFDLNRDRYKKLQIQFQDLVIDLIVRISDFDPAIQLLSAKECTFRINRDIRFSNDKSPYKTRMAAAFSPSAKNGSTPSYYFQIDSDGKCMIGGGEYMIEPPRLLMIRTALAKDSKPFKKILKDSEFKQTFGELQGDRLITHPKGFDKNHPDIELLKHKNFIASKYIENVSSLSQLEFETIVLKAFKTLNPLIVYLRSIKLN